MRLPPWKLERESKLKDLTEDAVDEEALVAEDTEETPEANE